VNTNILSILVQLDKGSNTGLPTTRRAF